MDKSYYQKYEPVFGVWKITKLLGEGSYGKVFELEREDFGVVYKAALKVITIPTNDSEILDARAEGMDEQSIRNHFKGFVQELAQEFELMSHFKGNSNVVSYENHQVIAHADNVGWDILIQMELLKPLNKYTLEHSITRQDVIRLGIDLCKALEICQKYNVIHRDVKPENIFVSENGDFKLGDFGIARTVERTTSSLSKKGTYTYMAPEVYKGEAYGSSVDIYSLGIVMYRLLNGNRTPFLPNAPAYISQADRDNALLKRMGGAPLPKPIYAEGRLAEIVLKACAYEPKDRYSSPMMMRQELEAILCDLDEQKYIYRDGDEVPQDSYVKTADAQQEAKDRTASRFGNNADKTVSGFGKNADKTVSGFGKSADKTVSGFGKNADRTVSGFGKSADKTTSGFDGGFDRRNPAVASNRMDLKGPTKAVWPILAGLFMQALFSVIGFIIMLTLGKRFAMAIYSSAWLYALAGGAGISVGIGALMSISSNLRTGNKAAAVGAVRAGLKIVWVLSALFILIGLNVGKFVIGADSVTVMMGIIWGSRIGLFALVVLHEALFEACLVASGKTKQAMVSMLIGGFVQLCMTSAFVGLNVDMTLPMIVGHGVAAIVALILNLKTNELLHFRANRNLPRVSVRRELRGNMGGLMLAQLMAPIFCLVLSRILMYSSDYQIPCTAVYVSCGLILLPTMGVNSIGFTAVANDYETGGKAAAKRTFESYFMINAIVMVATFAFAVGIACTRLFGVEPDFIVDVMMLVVALIAMIQTLAGYLQAMKQKGKSAAFALAGLVLMVVILLCVF